MILETKMADSELIGDDNLTKTVDIIVDVNTDDENIDKIVDNNEQVLILPTFYSQLVHTKALTMLFCAFNFVFVIFWH